MKNFYLSPALALVLTCLLIIPIITLVSPATTSDAAEFSSAVITEDRNEIDFELAGQFNGNVQTMYQILNTLLNKIYEKIEAINLDFVIRIREYPTDKKGKKKSIILD